MFPLYKQLVVVFEVTITLNISTCFGFPLHMPIAILCLLILLDPLASAGKRPGQLSRGDGKEQPKSSEVNEAKDYH